MNDVIVALALAILATLVWLANQIRVSVAGLREVQGQLTRLSQQTIDLLSVRLPEPTAVDLRERARRSALRCAELKTLFLFQGFARAALQHGSATTKDLKEDELTYPEVAVVAQISKWRDPEVAARWHLPEEEVAKLPKDQRERAEHLARWFGHKDLDETQDWFFPELIRKGALNPES